MTKLVVKGKNINVTDALKDYAEKKFGKLEKYSQNLVEIIVELHVEKNPRIADNNIVAVTVYANGAVLRAEEASPDMYASMDLVMDKLERQLTKYQKTKVKSKTGKLKTSMVFAEKETAVEDMDEVEEIEEFVDEEIPVEIKG